MAARQSIPAKQLASHRARRIGRLVGTALLQARHHEPDEIVETFRHDRARQVEAIDAGLFAPDDQGVGNRLCRADPRCLAAAQHHLLQQLATGPLRARAAGHGLDIGHDRLALAGVDGLVDVVVGKVDAHGRRSVHQGTFGTGVTLVVGKLLLCLRIGLGGDDGCAQEHLDVVGTAPLRHGLRPDALHDLLHRGLALAVQENTLRVGRGKTRAARRRAGLVEQRCALGRGLAQVHGMQLVLQALVMHLVHPRRIGVDTAVAGTQHGTVFPTAFPQLVDQGHVFVGQVITVIVGGLAAHAIGPGRTVEVAGDDVPADASARQVVQRGHAPGKQKGRFVGEVGRDTKTQVLCHRGHGGNQQGGVVDRYLHRAPNRRIRAGAQHVVHADDVRKKDAVEQARLQPAGIVGPIMQFAVARGLVARVCPQTLLDMADAIHVERVEVDFLGHCGSVLFQYSGR